MSLSAVRSRLAAHGGLATISELAERWGVTKQWVRILARRDSFPAPVRTLGGRELWLVDEADAAFAAHETRTLDRHTHNLNPERNR